MDLHAVLTSRRLEAWWGACGERNLQIAAERRRAGIIPAYKAVQHARAAGAGAGVVGNHGSGALSRMVEDLQLVQKVDFGQLHTQL